MIPVDIDNFFLLYKIYDNMFIKPNRYIKEIYNMTWIKTILLKGFDIEDIRPLSNCRLLKNIIVPNNKITDIQALYKFNNLKYVDLSGNKLSNIRQLYGLSSLYCVYINDLEVSSCVISKIKRTLHIKY